MSHIPRYVRGEWLADCDVCGATRLASELKMRWDGFRVDARCWEPRHPQDFVRGKVDQQAPPWTAPEQADTFVGIGTLTAIADSATADIAIADNETYVDTPLTGTFTL